MTTAPLDDPQAPADAPVIDAVRAFNRFYTHRLGLLDEHLHASGFTLAEARVLFELSGEEALAAAPLARRLGLDPGYLSRILAKFERAGLVATRRCPTDRRRSLIALTTSGRAVYAPLLERSRGAVRGMLDAAPPMAAATLLRAMAEIRAALDRDAAGGVEIRAPQPGEVGWIVHRHGAYYAERYGFDARFEALVAEVAGRCLARAGEEREGAWIAAQGPRVVGSVFVSEIDAARAQLRLLFVEPDLRGQGLGRALAARAIAFAQAAGYAELTLWTNDVLQAAQALYESLGFQRVSSEPHERFGPPMTGLTYALDLQA